MVDRSFNVFILFTICFSVVMDVANADTTSSSSSSSSSSSGTSYSTEINNGEIGMKFKFDSKVSAKMAVEIYYDTETASATDFFTNQFTAAVFDGFNGCNVIDWNIMPCGTTKLNNGVLTCPLGPTQCSFDVTHACVASLYGRSQEAEVVKFVICFFASNKDVNTCLGKNPGFVSNDINVCVSSKRGETECDAFFTKIHGSAAHQVIGTPTGSASTEGTSAFTATLCEYLGKANLACSYCPVVTPPTATPPVTTPPTVVPPPSG